MIMHQFATGLQAHYRWQQLTVPDELRDEGDPTEQGYVAEHWLLHDEKRLEDYQLTYDLARRTLQVQQAGVGVSIHQWDTQHQITDYTDVCGARWQFSWNEKRQLCTVTDPLGGEYPFEYDERGNLSASTNPENEKQFTEWDEDFALPCSQIMPHGGTWYYQYSARGDLISVIDPAEQITRYDYDEHGDLIRQVDAGGNETRYAYNARGQVIRQIDCSGYLTRVEYDPWGQLQRLTDASGALTSYGFSASGLLEQQVLPDGRTAQFTYDTAGQLASVTSPAGDITRFIRNPRGQVTERQAPQQPPVRFEYDRLGRLVSLRNENGEAYPFAYDSLHRLTAEYDLSGQCKQYQYNALGALVTLTHYPEAAQAALQYSPLLTTFERDAVGRVRARMTHEHRIEYQYAPQAVTLTRFSRGEWAQAHLEQRDPVVLDTLSFAYDTQGQMTAENNHGGQYQHHYDPLGNLLQTVLPDGRALRHLYYGSGHLQQTNLTDGAQTWVLAEYERDRLHREVRRRQGALQQQTTYDACGRISATVSGLGEQATVFAPRIDKRYRYDAHDNLIERVVNDGQGDRLFHYGPRDAEQYHYDPVGQITAKTRGYETTTYSYDAAANRLDSPTSLAPHNQVSQFADHRYQYDGFGRLVVRTDERRRRRQFFEYNSEHRLTGVRFEGDAELSHVAYAYDALGRRTQKTLYHHAAPSAAAPAPAPEIITFLWSGMVMCGESSSRKPKNQVLYTYREGSYAPLARIDTFHHEDEESGETHHAIDVFYYHNHLNGMPEELTDEQGEIIWRGQSNLWGHTQHEQAPQYTVVPQNLKLQGQYLDRETGLHYNTFRYYDPVMGRFTQPDPIGLAGGINLYQYAPNPLGWIDPLGLQRTWCGRPQNKSTRHSTRKGAKEAAGHAHNGKKRPQPPKNPPPNATPEELKKWREKWRRYNQQQKYGKPESHPDSSHPDPHYHEGQKPDISSQGDGRDINNHHTF